jgi:hypothetical protein
VIDAVRRELEAMGLRPNEAKTRIEDRRIAAPRTSSAAAARSGDGGVR